MVLVPIPTNKFGLDISVCAVVDLTSCIELTVKTLGLSTLCRMKATLKIQYRLQHLENPARSMTAE